MRTFNMDQLENELQKARLVKVCAWCQRVQLTEKGPWLPPMNNPTHGMPLVSHGICPDCAKKWRK